MVHVFLLCVVVEGPLREIGWAFLLPTVYPLALFCLRQQAFFSNTATRATLTSVSVLLVRGFDPRRHLEVQGIH